jgi:hypothetical protein
MANYQDLLDVWTAHKTLYPKTDIELSKPAIDEMVLIHGEGVYGTLLEWLKRDLSEEATRLSYKSPTRY